MPHRVFSFDYNAKKRQYGDAVKRSTDIIYNVAQHTHSIHIDTARSLIIAAFPIQTNQIESESIKS